MVEWGINITIFSWEMSFIVVILVTMVIFPGEKYSTSFTEVDNSDTFISHTLYHNSHKEYTHKHCPQAGNEGSLLCYQDMVVFREVCLSIARDYTDCGIM